MFRNVFKHATLHVGFLVRKSPTALHSYTKWREKLPRGLFLWDSNLCHLLEMKYSKNALLISQHFY